MDNDLRLKLSKTGKAVYISHLDLMRTMQRAFLRSDIPLKYSEGFNPHAQISFALPLSLGIASECELMDFKLKSFMALPEIVFRLNRTLPEGIKVLEVYEQENKFKNIKWIDVNGIFEYDNVSPSEIIDDITDFFAQDSIVIEKKTKSGIGPMDIAPAIHSICFDCSERLIFLEATLSAQEPTMNPENLVSALKQLKANLAPDFASFTRKEIYDADMTVFK